MTATTEPNIGDVIGRECNTARGSSLKKSRSPVEPCSDKCEGEEAKEEKRTAKVSCWANSGDNYWGIAKTYQTLPSKCYKACQSQTGVFLEEVPVITDSLLILPDDASKQILSDFSQFWELKDHFTARGFLHKRGILMWGPPGSGKTSTIQLIIKSVIDELDGIVLMVEHPSVAVDGLKMIRKIEPYRPVVAVLEDMDSLVSRFDECGFLAMLDGEAQVDNIVHLATTNYPERLDPRFIDRPSRFDLIRYVGMPSAAARKFYLENKEPSLTPEEMDLWVESSEGLTIPHLKEMIISVKCYGKPLAETVNRMKDMHRKKFKAEGAKSLGFGGEQG